MSKRIYITKHEDGFLYADTDFSDSRFNFSYYRPSNEKLKSVGRSIRIMSPVLDKVEVCIKLNGNDINNLKRFLEQVGEL
jgi:hypothetical protein